METVAVFSKQKKKIYYHTTYVDMLNSIDWVLSELGNADCQNARDNLEKASQLIKQKENELFVKKQDVVDVGLKKVDLKEILNHSLQ